VATQLCNCHPGLSVDLVYIKTRGDQDQHSPLTAIGGTGLFTKEIQRAVLDGTVDIAVHSLKDLPTDNPKELMLVAVPVREDVSDALIAPVHRRMQAMPPGSRIGTSSLRRRAQLLYAYPELEVITVRGNVETRLNLALEGKLDGIILAYAGLKRLNLQSNITDQLSPPNFLPAVGQGALGIECRSEDTETQALVSSIDCPQAHCAVLAERAVLAQLQGGCSIPMGAWARELPGKAGEATMLGLDVAVFDPNGKHRVRVSLQGSWDDPVGLGHRAVASLHAKGAKELLANT
jgi:hydroxymethylbilane synthase